MLTREDIGYHARWVRLLCCLAVATGVANGVHFGLLDVPEHLLREWLVFSESFRFRYASELLEICILFSLSLLPAWPRVERPILMVAFAIGMLIAYVFAVLVGILSAEFVLPLASPLIVILGSSAVMETMAWSEERLARRKLESREVAREQFTDMLVHDLRKRLSSVLVSFSLLEKQLSGTRGEQVSLLHTIRTSADRLLILINNLLDVRKIEEGSMSIRLTEVSLGELLAECMHEHAGASEISGVQFERTGNDDLLVRADRELVARMVTNLLWNAMQHAAQDSAIEVECSLRSDGSAALRVANRGTPIPEDVRPGLFHAYNAETSGSRAAGTGLGLTFCKLAIEAHGGSISLESPRPEHGDGAEAILFFPANSVVR